MLLSIWYSRAHAMSSSNNIPLVQYASTANVLVAFLQADHKRKLSPVRILSTHNLDRVCLQHLRRPSHVGQHVPYHRRQLCQVCRLGRLVIANWDNLRAIVLRREECLWNRRRQGVGWVDDVGCRVAAASEDCYFLCNHRIRWVRRGWCLENGIVLLKYDD